jgi:hypothetical protein
LFTRSAGLLPQSATVNDSFVILYDNRLLGQIQYFLCICNFTSAVVERFDVVEQCTAHFSLPSCVSSLDSVIVPVWIAFPLHVDLVDVNSIRY